jgi:DNA-binding LacI/PurR family transcriptional regulator
MAHTIKDVSRLAEVSTATVSRTFSNPETVSEATRERVFEAARMLNYQPNAIARSMKLQQTERIAFLICKESGSILDEFYAGICNGIMQEMNQTDYQLLISTERDWTFGKRNQVDGVILGGNTSLQLIRDCVRQGARIVLVNNEIEGFTFPTVVSDEERGVQMAVEHLIARGHKKIATLAGRFSPYICQQRLHAFTRTMQDNGLKVGVPVGIARIEANANLLKVSMVLQTVGKDAQPVARTSDNQFVVLADIGKEVVADRRETNHDTTTA